MEEERPNRDNHVQNGDQKSEDKGQKNHFNSFTKELENQQESVNPTMNIINFYKILFNEISNINLDMNDVLKNYKNEAKDLKPNQG